MRGCWLGDSCARARKNKGMRLRRVGGELGGSGRRERERGAHGRGEGESRRRVERVSNRRGASLSLLLSLSSRAPRALASLPRHLHAPHAGDDPHPTCCRASGGRAEKEGARRARRGGKPLPLLSAKARPRRASQKKTKNLDPRARPPRDEKKTHLLGGGLLGLDGLLGNLRVEVGEGGIGDRGGGERVVSRRRRSKRLSRAKGRRGERAVPPAPRSDRPLP